MPYKITYLATFYQSYKAVVSYLSDYSASTAINFDTELKQQIEIIATMPFLFRKYEHSKNHIRQMLLKSFSYYVIYFVDEVKKEIRLIDLIHTSRDINAVIAIKLKKLKLPKLRLSA